MVITAQANPVDDSPVDAPDTYSTVDAPDTILTCRCSRYIPPVDALIHTHLSMLLMNTYLLTLQQITYPVDPPGVSETSKIPNKDHTESEKNLTVPRNESDQM